MLATLADDSGATPGTTAIEGQRLPKRNFVDRLLLAGPWRFALVLFLLALLLRLPVFFYPFFNGDEATYRALANALLDGNWLYVGAVDHKPPMIYLTYAAILAACGRYRMHDVHLCSILVVFATAILVGAVATNFGMDQRRSRLAAILYVVLGVLGPGKDMLAANGELFMLLPTAAAVWVMGRAMQSAQLPGLARIAAAGALVGAAALYKYQASATLVPLVAHIARSGTGRTIQWRRFSALIVLVSGCLAPCAGVVAIWSLGGHVRSLAFWAWQFPLSYAGMLSRNEVMLNGLRMTPQWLLPVLPLLWLATSGGRTLLASKRPSDRQFARFCIWWGCSALLGVFAGGRFFLHYYLQLTPAIALLAAACSPPGPWVTRGTMAYLGLFLGGFWIANAIDHRARPRIERYTGIYRSIGQWVDQHLAREARILVWGNSPEIYHFSRRSMGTRFPFCNYQSGKMWGTKLDREGELDTQQGVLEAAWPMLLEDLEARRPEAIIDAASAGLDRWGGHEVSRYPKLWAIVQRDYQPIAKVAGATIYRRIRP